MSAIINPRAHALAHGFVALHWDELSPSVYDASRSQIVFNVELWLTLSTAKLPVRVLEKAMRCYENDFASPAHDPATRLDIIESLADALLAYVNAPSGQLTRCDLIVQLLRYEARNDRPAARRRYP